MNRKKLGLFILVNAVVISLGALIVYNDLWMRRDTPIKVEWYPLGYRPTYRVWDTVSKEYIVIRGSLTLDLLQLSAILMAVVDIFLVVNARWLPREKI